MSYEPNCVGGCGQCKRCEEEYAKLALYPELLAALRRALSGVTIISDTTTHHLPGCDGYACRDPKAVMDAAACRRAQAIIVRAEELEGS